MPPPFRCVVPFPQLPCCDSKRHHQRHSFSHPGGDCCSPPGGSSGHLRSRSSLRGAIWWPQGAAAPVALRESGRRCRHGCGAGGGRGHGGRGAAAGAPVPRAGRVFSAAAHPPAPRASAAGARPPPLTPALGDHPGLLRLCVPTWPERRAALQIACMPCTSSGRSPAGGCYGLS
jgi:hypothetical protein